MTARRLIVHAFALLLATACLVDAVRPASARDADPATRASACFNLLVDLDFHDVRYRRSVCSSDVDRLWRKPLRSTLVTREAGEPAVKTCADYVSRYGYGGYAISRVEVRDEAPFIRTCGVLRFLEGARIGKNAYATPADILSVRHLPRSLLYYAVTDDEENVLERADATDVPDTDLERSATVSHPNPNELEIVDENSSVSIRVIAVADIDGDGINDYLVERSYGCSVQCSMNDFFIGYLAPRKGKNLLQIVWRAAESGTGSDSRFR